MIRQGAKLAGCAADILEKYGWEAQPLSAGTAQVLLPVEEVRVYAALDAETSRSLDEIIAGRARVRPESASFYCNWSCAVSSRNAARSVTFVA